MHVVRYPSMKVEVQIDREGNLSAREWEWG